MLTGIIKKLKLIWNLPDAVHKLNCEQVYIKNNHDSLYKLIQERTTVHSDLHFYEGLHNVIVIGRYRNKDYVRLFNVETDSFRGLVEILIQMEKDAKTGRFDAPFRFPIGEFVTDRFT